MTLLAFVPTCNEDACFYFSPLPHRQVINSFTKEEGGGAGGAARLASCPLPVWGGGSGLGVRSLLGAHGAGATGDSSTRAQRDDES